MLSDVFETKIIIKLHFITSANVIYSPGLSTSIITAMVDELVFLLHHTSNNNSIAGIVTNHTRRVFLFCATITDNNNMRII